jgi:hypothetical protein
MKKKIPTVLGWLLWSLAVTLLALNLIVWNISATNGILNVDMLLPGTLFIYAVAALYVGMFYIMVRR